MYIPHKMSDSTITQEVEVTDLTIKVKNRKGNKCNIYATEPLRQNILNNTKLLSQISNIFILPGVNKQMIGLPDIHPGYVFPIGTVTPFDLSNDPCVFPGGCGYDINCGVGCHRTNLMVEDLNWEEVIDKVECKPCEVNVKDLNGILDMGLECLVKRKIIKEEYLTYTESRGSVLGDSRRLSQKIKGRGIHQYGTMGTGNHYIEVQYVESIYNKEICDLLGLKKEQIILSVHSGSRGLGHAVCSDSLSKFNYEVSSSQVGGYADINNSESVYLNMSHKLSCEYMTNMSSACNFAFCNRVMIAEQMFGILRGIFPRLDYSPIYDTSHNTLRVENDMEALVVRKGASRILEPYNSDLPFLYKEIGQPVMVGGSMGTSSYILVGDDCVKTYRSTCHGSGRVVQRRDSGMWNYDEVMNDLKSKNILVKSGSKKGILTEAPGCYKDIDEVVRCSELNKITKTACRVKPLVVIKDL